MIILLARRTRVCLSSSCKNCVERSFTPFGSCKPIIYYEDFCDWSDCAQPCHEPGACCRRQITFRAWTTASREHIALRGGTTSSQQDTCRLCLPTATSWRAARADTGSTVKRLQAAFRAGVRAGSASTGIHAEIRARPAASTPRARSFADKWCRRPAWHRTCLRTAHAGAGFERAGIQHPVDSASSSLASTWWQGDTWWAGRGAGREPYNIYVCERK